MGDTGPCGPCSEIHYDLTPKGNANASLVNADNPEVIEIWNLVFIQYNRRSDGSLDDLAAKHVDTGMGFERICSVLQQKVSNYDTDIFTPLIEKVAELSGRSYDGNDAIAMRVIADHVRTLSIAISDGVLPSNDGRGYVLRRLLRRAVRYGRNLGFKQPFLCDLFPTLEVQLGKIFPELVNQRDTIIRALMNEEESFSKTLDRGITRFEKVASSLSDGSDFPGEEAFSLYDTYGFPFDLTSLMASEKGLCIDEKVFTKLMEEQRARARASRDTGSQNAQMDLISDLVTNNIQCEFLGYHKTFCDTEILAVLDSGALVLKETPFYPEGGGQQGDRGELKGPNFAFEVTDTQKPSEGIIIHIGKVLYGSPEVGMKVMAGIDRYRRGQMRRNHTATHLLNAALRDIVDSSIKQAGSLVSAERLRFDFNYFEAIPIEELQQIEQVVNHEIMKNTTVETREMALADVQNNPRIQAVFDDKYGDRVRVVGVGDFSQELCGGTHVQFTGDIGSFRIVSESSIASGVRRIEAVTGMEAVDWTAEEHELLIGVSQKLSVKPDELPARIISLNNQLREAEKKIKSMQSQLATSNIDSYIEKLIEINGVPFLSLHIGELPMDNLRQVLDQLRQKIPSGVILVASESSGKACFAASISDDFVNKGIHAGQLIGKVAAVADGGGGGKPEKAQAGGKDPSKIEDALREAKKYLESILT
jgi:alanyl-tRNA synthetase